VSGALWATASGIGFGLFQALNAKAVRDLDDVYVSTFLQLLVAAVVLLAASVATEDLGALGGATAWAILAFALAGMIHFFVGWTTLNLSQRRIGAARTSPLLSMTPLFGLVFGLVLASQVPGWPSAVAIALTIGGAYLVATPGSTIRPGPYLPEPTPAGNPGRGLRPHLRDSAFGLVTACAWSASAIFTLEGLDGLDSPLLGVTIGMLAAALAYGAVVAITRTPLRLGAQERGALAAKLLAGVIVALATWGRWVALDDTDVAVVLALNLASVPVVLVAAPLISGRHVEIVTARIWAGAGLVIAGSLLLIAES
jgi:drug/metabolite transporter (DMT)-like permease